jgi:Tfp pilus assembly protein PilN
MDGVWLTRIRFTEDGEISISGRATRPELVAAYLERLRSQPALREQPFSRLELTRPAAPYVEFMISSGEAEGAK